MHDNRITAFWGWGGSRNILGGPGIYELAFSTTQGWFRSQAVFTSGSVPSDLRKHVPQKISLLLSS